jgi:2-succinyl-6-hydroxy-2,4-cyclohexadiene-1-carboxylate synthase
MRVLFIPGFMQRGEAWRPVAELLPQRYPSELLDHQAHDYEGRLAEVAAVGDGAVLVGYSLGGRLALRAALRDPGRYAGLVTVGATAGIEDPEARSARRRADDELAASFEEATIEEVVARWERQPVFANQSAALVEAQRAGRLSHDPRELALLLRSAGQGVLDPVWRELPTLGELPLLALAGARDEPYLRAARRLAQAVSRGRMAAIETAGHAAQSEQPQAVATLLAAFLDEVSSPATASGSPSPSQAS